MPGPPRKRDAERRRRNKDGIETTKVNLDELIAKDVEIPQPPMTNWIKVMEEDEETGRFTEQWEWVEEPVCAWEPLTLSFWNSFQRSGQAIWYEPSDWMTAYALMEILDRWLKPQDVKVGQIGTSGEENSGGNITYLFEPKILAMPGGVLTSILKGLTALMATEGDRRRLRIELERKAALDAALSGDGKVVDIVQRRADAFKREARG